MKVVGYPRPTNSYYMYFYQPWVNCCLFTDWIPYKYRPINIPLTDLSIIKQELGNMDRKCAFSL